MPSPAPAAWRDAKVFDLAEVDLALGPGRRHVIGDQCVIGLPGAGADASPALDRAWRLTGQSTRHDPLPRPSTPASSTRMEPLPGQSIMPPLRGSVDSPAILLGFCSYRVKHLFGSALPGPVCNEVDCAPLCSRSLHYEANVQENKAMTASTPAPSPLVRPFTVAISDSEIEDLKQRLARTRWPNPETVADWSQGVRLGNAKTLIDYWERGYDWRRFESELNRFPQFLTAIDGLDIHFIHVKSKNPNAMPLILTHEWPGSIVEFLKVIGPAD
jgi:hypothetical protein